MSLAGGHAIGCGRWGAGVALGSCPVTWTVTSLLGRMRRYACAAFLGSTRSPRDLKPPELLEMQWLSVEWQKEPDWEAGGPGVNLGWLGNLSWSVSLLCEVG